MLLVRRFDRNVVSGKIRRIPFASMMTMCDLREYAVEGSYQELAYATRKDIYDQSYAEKDRLEIYRRMVFNILCGNCDDHPRNHGFILGSNGWHLSPAYDITPMVSFENCLFLRVGKYDKAATKENALSEARAFGLEKNEAEAIFTNIKNTVVSEWEKIFLTAGVSQQELQSLSKCFSVALETEK